MTSQLPLIPPDPPPSIYAIDASSIMELDDAHLKFPGISPQPPRFTPGERVAIWGGLESIAKDGRLKLLDKIRADLRRNYKDVVPKMSSWAGVAIRTTPTIETEYQRLLRLNPTAMTFIQHHANAASDAYLVAVCNQADG